MNRILPLFLLFGCGQLLAQTTISGLILDQEAAPISFANITLTKEKDSIYLTGVVSDEMGNFSLGINESGNYILQISFVGFETYSDTLALVSNESKVLENPIILKNNNQVLNEVDLVVRKRLYEREIDRTIVNVKGNTINIGASALVVMENSPGVIVERTTGAISMLGKQGVLVFINGKQTRMSGNSLIQLLDAMPSSNIEKLELITNPPASFDAEGNAGIINIVLNKELNNGFFGTVTGTMGYADDKKYGVNLNLQYNRNKISVYGDLATNNDYNSQNMTIYKAYEYENDFYENKLFSQRPSYTAFHQGKIGIDYKLNKKTIIGGFLIGRLNIWELDAYTETLNSLNMALSSKEALFSFEINNWKHYMANIYFQHHFSEQTSWTFDYDYLNYHNNNDTDYQLTVDDGIPENLESNDFFSKATTDTDFHVLKTDIAIQITKKANLNFGAKATFSDFTNDAIVFNETDGETTMFLNRVLIEKIGAIYFDSDFQLSEKTRLKLGARYEYTDSKFEVTNQNFLLDRQYGNLFPSIFLSHKFNENLSMNWSYGERITRPSINVLSPSFFFFDSNTLLTGNPSIKPTITQTLGMDINYKTLNLLVQFNNQKNPFTRGQPEFSEDYSQTILSPQPLLDRKIFSSSLSFPIKFSNKLKSQHTIIGVWRMEEMIYDETPLKRKKWYANLSSFFQYQINTKWSADMSFNFYSPRFSGLAEYPSSWALNLGSAYRFNKNIVLALSYRDIFSTDNYIERSYDLPQDHIIYGSRYKLEGGILSLSLKVNFGNRGEKKFSKRASGSKEEQRRIQ